MSNIYQIETISLYQRILASVPFVLLFMFNIGSKELFNVLGSFDAVEGGVLILSLFVFLIFLGGRSNYKGVRTVIFLFYIFLVISSLSSTNTAYGLQKAFLGLLIPFLSFEIFIKKKRSELAVLDGLIIVVLFLDIIAVIYKIRMGFFVRAVNFGVLGPITLGWLNGMAFLSLVLQRKKTVFNLFLILLLFLVILWTGSKGPLVSSIAITFLGFKRVFGTKLKTKILVIVGLFLVILFISTYGDNIRSVKSLTEFFSNPDEYTQGVGSGSIGTRQEYLNISKEMFLSNPIFGIGFGGWNSSFLIGHKYPHNVLFEILAELGLFGLFFMIVLLARFSYFNIFGYIALFGLLALMFSGDFSYLRYAIFPLLISYYFYVKKEGNPLSSQL